MKKSPPRFKLKKKLTIVVSMVAEGALLVKALKIALIVGTLLNFINQGEAIMALAVDKILWGKLLLTYTIPFLVSTYTAVSMGFAFKIGDVAPVTTQVDCKSCKSTTLQITQGELIPECPHCGIHTQWRL